MFWLAAALLCALAVWLLRPARARAEALPAAVRADTGPIGILKAQLVQLDHELAAGLLSASDHRAARLELERRVLAEAPASPRVGSHAGRPKATWAALGLFVPLSALALYLGLGRSAAVEQSTPLAAASATTGPAAEPSAEDVQRMVDALAQRLQSEPALAKDADAWSLLGRSYSAMQRFEDADRAYARAAEIKPDDAQLLADRADALALLNGRSAAGEPTRLIERALQIDPSNLKALALAGSAALERNDLPAAIGLWQRARRQAEPGSDFALGLDRSLAELQARASPGGRASTPQAAAPADEPVPGSEGRSVAAAAGAVINGRVVLAPALAARVLPSDTVFISARAVDGPRMPLAALKRTAAELPFDFMLDDSQSMSPTLKLSGFKEVLVTARISRSGQPLPQAGDLQAQARVDTAARGRIVLTIDGP